MDKTLISVLMTSYNSSAWIEEAICSILNQTFKDFEFIIIDDGSSDNTRNIILKYALQDKRIKFYKRKHVGLTNSLIFGLKKCNGEWIARIDSDDHAFPERLELQYNFIKSNPRVAALGSSCKIFYQNNKKENLYSYPHNHKDLLKSLLIGSLFPPHSSMMFNKNVALRAGGYNSKMFKAQDWDLWLRIAKIGKLAALKRPLVMIRIHKSQISSLSAHDSIRQTSYSLVARLNFYINRNNSIYAQDSLSSKYAFNRMLFMADIFLEKNQIFDYLNWKQSIKKHLEIKNRIKKIKFIVQDLKSIKLFFLFCPFLLRNAHKFLSKTWIKTNTNA